MASEEVNTPVQASETEREDKTVVESEAAPNAEINNSAAEREPEMSGEAEKKNPSASADDEHKETVPKNETQENSNDVKQKDELSSNDTRKDETAAENEAKEEKQTEEGKKAEGMEAKEEKETKDSKNAVCSAAEKQNGEAEGAVGGVNPRNFNGKYSHVKSENLDDLFKALGVPWLIRKMLKRVNHSSEIVQDGEKFDIKLCTGFMTKEWKFTVGEDFEDKPMGWSNDTMIVHSSWEGDKLVMNSVPKSDKAKAKPMKVTRQLNGDEMTMVMEIENVVCTRIFKKKN